MIAVLIVSMFILTSCSTGSEYVLADECEGTNASRITAGASTKVEKLEKIYLFVRDEIEFNWVYPQDIPAEQVLANRCGVCMQKANLFSSLAQQEGFKTRFRFMYVRKQALQDFVPEWAFNNWVDPFPHTVVEVCYNGEWISFDPSFDSKLIAICHEKKLNYCRYPEISEKYSADFSIKGVKGPQEYWAVEEPEPFYGDDLSPLMEYEKKQVPFFKQKLKPLIFSRARSMMNKLRNQG